MRAGGNPLLVGLKLDAHLVVEDPQVAILTPGDCIRLNRLHILRHNTDISFVAAVIAEAIEANAVGKVTEKNNIVLECDVRSPSTAAATSTAATTTTDTSATAATTADTATTAATAETGVAA
jgi:hypothetical protein